MNPCLYILVLLIVGSCLTPSVLNARPMFADPTLRRHSKKEKTQKVQEAKKKDGSPRLGRRVGSPSFNPLRLFGTRNGGSRQDEELSPTPLGRQEISPPSSPVLFRSKSAICLEDIAIEQAQSCPPSTAPNQELKAVCYSQMEISPCEKPKSVDNALGLGAQTHRGHLIRKGPSLEDVVKVAPRTPRCVGAPVFPVALQKPKMSIFTPSQDPGYTVIEHMEDIDKKGRIDVLMYRTGNCKHLTDDVILKSLHACLVKKKHKEIKVIEFGDSPFLTDDTFSQLHSWANVQQLNIHKAHLFLDSFCLICENLPRLTHLNIRQLACPEFIDSYKKYYPVFFKALMLLDKLEELDMSYIQGFDGLLSPDVNQKRLQFINKNLRSLFALESLRRVAAEGWPLDQETFLLFFLKKQWVSIAIGPLQLCADFLQKYEQLEGFFHSFSLDQREHPDETPWGSYDHLMELKGAVPALKLIRLRHPQSLGASEAESLRKKGVDLSLCDQDDACYLDPYATWGYQGEPLDT